MTIRMAPLVVAVAALAFAGSPAFAQDAGGDPGSPPPLPELGDASWDEEWDEYIPQASNAAPSPEESRALPGETSRVLGYSEAERDAWLRECHERTRGRPGVCEDYLARYEQAVRSPALVQDVGCSYSAAPVTWVRVPIVRPARPR